MISRALSLCGTVDIRSATKSVTSLLMGIAIQKGLARSADDPISLYLPGLPKDGKEKITIHVRDEALIQLERLATQTRNEVRILYVRTKTVVAAMNTPKT